MVSVLDTFPGPDRSASSQGPGSGVRDGGHETIGRLRDRTRDLRAAGRPGIEKPRRIAVEARVRRGDGESHAGRDRGPPAVVRARGPAPGAGPRREAPR